VGTSFFTLAVGFGDKVHSEPGKHHPRSTFKSEYMTLLRKFDVAFDEKYVFDFQEWRRGSGGTFHPSGVREVVSTVAL
jgi:hypothetical protein